MLRVWRPRSARVVSAAARLAAAYAAGVSALLLALLVAVERWDRLLGELPTLAVPAAVCFALGFLLLAAARRAGFTALWGRLLALWAWLGFFVVPPHGRHPGVNFILWSILAAPLCAICEIGFGAERRRAWGQWLLWACWVALAVAGVRNEYGAASAGAGSGVAHAAWAAVEFAWLAGPPALCAATVFRIHRRADHGAQAA